MSELIREPSLLINGEWVPGTGPECEVENPATEQLAGISTQASLSEVDAAVIARTADAFEEFSFRSEMGNSVIVRQPVGVVAAITPWNLPLHQVVVKIVPALAVDRLPITPSGLWELTQQELTQ